MSLLKLPENKEMKVVFEGDVSVNFTNFFDICLADNSVVPYMYCAEREETNMLLGKWEKEWRYDG